MKIHWKFFWIIQIFCLIKINATDSNSKNEESANVGQEKMALSSQEMVEIGENERNEASSSKKRKAETEMELYLGKREAIRILMNMLRPVFITFTEHIIKARDDACKILKEDEVIKQYKKFKAKINIKENKKEKDTEFNKFMRKMDRNIGNEIKNIEDKYIKNCLEHILFFRIMLQIANLIEGKRGIEILLSDTESDNEINKDDKEILYGPKIKKSIDLIEIWIKKKRVINKKKVNQEENYKIFMENYVNKIKINLKNDKTENENDIDEDDDEEDEDDEDDDNETLSDRSKRLKGIQNDNQSSMETSSTSDFEYEAEETSADDDYKPTKSRNGMKRKRNHQINPQNSDSEDNQPIGKRRNILVQALPIQPINPSEVRFPNLQTRPRNSSKSPNNSGYGHTSPSKNAHSNPSNSRASGTLRSKSPNQSHFKSHSAHSNSSSDPLMIHSPMDIENNSESIHSDSSSSKNSPPKLDSTSSQKRHNPESSNNPTASKKHATDNQQIDHLQQKLKTHSLLSNVPKGQRSLRKYKGKGLKDEQSKDLNPKQTNQFESNQIQVSDEHSAAINTENAKNSDHIYQAEMGSILHPNLGIPINQLMESPFLQTHSVQNRNVAGTSLSQQISADKNSMIPIEQLLPIEFNLPQMHHSPNLIKEIGPSSSKHVRQSKHSPSNKSPHQSESSKSMNGSASSSSQGQARGSAVEQSPRSLFDLNLPPAEDQN